MSRRTDRIARLIQQTVAEIVLEHISDPRIKPATLSVTRAEVAEDMTRAKVYCSVIGTDGEQRTAIRALQHAAGRIQELMMKQISLRFTPVLEFVPDVQFKKSLTTLALIQQAMNEIHVREQTSDQEDPRNEPAEPIDRP